MGKLREEVNTRSTDNADLTRADLRKMGYLQNVLKESESRHMNG